MSYRSSYKSLLSIFAILSMMTISLSAKNPTKLFFNQDSTFKIVQFTDLHLVLNSPKSEVAFQCIDSVMKFEKPDFVIITGDIIYSKPAKENFRNIMTFVSKYKVPFAFVFGNHDHQFEVSDRELLESVKDIPYNMTTTAPGISGDSNFAIPVFNQSGKKIESVLYGLDSHDETQHGSTGVKGYDYIMRDQIAWYVKTSSKFTKGNDGKPVPSVAFFHIPVPEYKEAALNQGKSLNGEWKEPVASSKLNSGLFCAMKEQGDIFATFCGHDHDNDFTADLYGVLLVYGRYTGGNTEYNNLGVNGARVIELKQGSRSVHTWVRLRNGEKLLDTFFPKENSK
jgi:3',5'-cyclic AMP phosphodiesterase CpdA